MYANMQRVGMPAWSAADEKLARAAQEGWQERLQQALVRLPPAQGGGVGPVTGEAKRDV